MPFRCYQTAVSLPREWSVTLLKTNQVQGHESALAAGLTIVLLSLPTGSAVATD